MTTFPARMDALAGRMITKFGESVTFYVPASHTRTGQTYTRNSPSEPTVTVGWEPPSYSARVNGAPVEKGRAWIWVRDSDIDFAPLPGLTLTRAKDSTKWTFGEGIEEYAAAGTGVAYRIPLKAKRT